jgi:predicted RNA-binding Zn-ribbon protein involved in translation (DUF1610 family)
MNAGKFKCKSCDHIWLSGYKMVTCPKCGHLYIIWLNYEELAKTYTNLKCTDLDSYAYGG